MIAQANNMSVEIFEEAMQRAVETALGEDIGHGDETSGRIVPWGAEAEACIYAKEQGVIAGLEVARATFKCAGVKDFEALIEDGQIAEKGDRVVEMYGKARGILKAERVALNFLQRLSGIATTTRKYVEAADGKAVILDTRKTTPGLRALEKYAVRMGGGQNHRTGLYDMVLIKDNHVDMAGGVKKAIEAVRKSSYEGEIEVEVRNFNELKEALEANPDRIMLDNMSLSEIKEAVEIVDSWIALEASGNMTLDRISEVAATGVDYISVGALTHSYKALDLSLVIEKVIKKQLI